MFTAAAYTRAALDASLLAKKLHDDIRIAKIGFPGYAVTPPAVTHLGPLPRNVMKINALGRSESR